MVKEKKLKMGEIIYYGKDTSIYESLNSIAKVKDSFKIIKNFCHLNKKKVVINKNIVVHKHLCMTNSSGPTKDKDLK